MGAFSVIVTPMNRLQQYYLLPHMPTIRTIQGKVCFSFLLSSSLLTSDPALMLSTSKPPITLFLLLVVVSTFCNGS